ncbi:TDT family transporter [Pseudonocardia xinjiangensis]|uniref:TDT family transporter n=1 Tax=Pseudonocardia xinjiangensis TaxID=75289 RepID=A0ABX1RAQ2_9PSEU|nr:TDT family transporter [Pseudonocardia xinjiangensis]NMH77460.1 TDT family transporter [Pseudonocardia xinjiangensis]
MPVARVPLNFFGMPFGLAGLGGCWLTAAEYGLAPPAFGEAILVVAALVWLFVVSRYVRDALFDRAAFARDLLDNVAGPFASLAVITPMLLAAEGLYPYAPVAGAIVTDVFIGLTVLLGSWFTGQWIYGPVDIDKFHPGYFLPTVAGGLVAAAAAAAVGQPRLAEVMFGLGMVCWFVVGSVILMRMFFRPLLPGPLLPTVAIEVAPPAVASLAYFTMTGDRVDTFASMLAGYGLLMVLSQMRLLPAYLRLPFMPSTWAFTFSWAAVANVAMHWVNGTRPSGYVMYHYVVLAAITVFIGGIAVRTVIALGRHQLLPRPPRASPAVYSVTRRGVAWRNRADSR